MTRLYSVLFLLASFYLTAQEKYFIKYYADQPYNTGRMIGVTNEDELIFSFLSFGPEEFSEEMIILKMDLAGNILAETRLSGDEYIYVSWDFNFSEGYIYMPGISASKTDTMGIYPFVAKILPGEEPIYNQVIPPLNPAYFGQAYSSRINAMGTHYLCTNRMHSDYGDGYYRSGIIYKLDSMGIVVDSLFYPANNYGMIVNSLIDRNSGGFYLIQNRESGYSHGYIRLFTTDENLIPLDSIDLHNPGNPDDLYQSHDLAESDLGDLYLFASTGNTKIFVTKLNADLDTLWVKKVLQTGQKGTIRWTSDHHILVCGTTWGTNLQPWKKWLMKLDSDGNILWERIWEIAEDSYLHDLIELNGEIYMAGVEHYPGAKDAILVHTNCMGLFTEPEASFMIEPGADNAYFFTNTSQFVYPDSIDGGHFLWQFGDGSSSTEESPYHSYTLPGAYWVELTAVVCNDTSRAGTCISLNGMPCDTPWIYTSTSDNTVEFIDKDLPALLTILPNPFDDYFSAIPGVTVTSPLRELILYNAEGRIVKKVYTHFDEIEVGHLPAGLYFYEAVFASGLRCNGKLMKLE